MEKLKKMQKPAGVQIDERVDVRIKSKMDSTATDTIQHIFIDNLNPMAFKKNGSRKHKKKQGSLPGDKKHKFGHTQQISQQIVGSKPAAFPIPSMQLITNANILQSQFVQPTQCGLTNEEQNIKCVTVPADQLPYLSFNDFRAGGSMHGGLARGCLRGRGRRGRGGKGFTINQGEFDPYSMDVAPINIFKNQGIPMGLHNLSKSFRPNSTTTTVFS